MLHLFGSFTNGVHTRKGGECRRDLAFRFSYILKDTSNRQANSTTPIALRIDRLHHSENRSARAALEV